jgi:hypothetical protein
VPKLLGAAPRANAKPQRLSDELLVAVGVAADGHRCKPITALAEHRLILNPQFAHPKHQLIGIGA